MNLIRFARAAAVVAVTLLAGPRPARADQPLMTGVSGPAVSLTYAHLTSDKGLWQKHGLDARVVVFESGATLAQVARAGEVKLSMSAGPATVAARTQGADAILVAGFVNTLPYSLITAKSITTWEQLKGKRIAISRFGSGTDTAIRLLLRRYNLDPVKDVTLLQVGTQPARLQALSAGAIDATLVSPPLDYQAKKQGFTLLQNIAEMKIPYPQFVVETSERYARENPLIVKNFIKGLFDGVHYAAANKEETKKTITKHLKTSDPELLELTYQSFLKATDYSGYPSLDGIRVAIDEVAARVPAVKNRPPEDFVDTRFLKELEKEGFLKRFQRKG